MRTPTTPYRPQAFPDVKRALRTLHAAAIADHNTDCMRYARAFPKLRNALIQMIDDPANHAPDHDLTIISIDIDLTIDIDEDFDDQLDLINPQTVTTLQDKGYLVGTCSDRDIHDQRAVMARFDVIPHFYIPKELLYAVATIMPGSRITHVGDDPLRDADVALQAGVHHLYPSEFLRRLHARQATPVLN